MPNGATCRQPRGSRGIRRKNRYSGDTRDAACDGRALQGVEEHRGDRRDARCKVRVLPGKLGSSRRQQRQRKGNPGYSRDARDSTCDRRDFEVIAGITRTSAAKSGTRWEMQAAARSVKLLPYYPASDPNGSRMTKRLSMSQTTVRTIGQTNNWYHQLGLVGCWGDSDVEVDTDVEIHGAHFRRSVSMFDSLPTLLQSRYDYKVDQMQRAAHARDTLQNMEIDASRVQEPSSTSGEANPVQDVWAAMPGLARCIDSAIVAGNTAYDNVVLKVMVVWSVYGFAAECVSRLAVERVKQSKRIMTTSISCWTPYTFVQMHLARVKASYRPGVNVLATSGWPQSS
ncbi:hypothetical protein CALCODRAFT_540621 [Calocera cornea HHB12733]|uniref:Uncharacterized protein n=1 Tax=Calocera cornea HHB12733 TaxID=1353952 RepID=A0A166LBM9_9BASI|nr:hypothetical protein CALCODRAFT_540621 [Calocera cornea HHB12733]